MDFSLSTHQQETLDTTEAFAAKEIAPHTQRLEEDVPFRIELYRKMARAGLFTLATKGDTIAYALALKAIAKADAGISVAMTVTNMVAEAIDTYGTPEQKQHYLPLINNGTIAPAAFALTELHAGSDAKSIEMTATRTHDNITLNGEKHLISNGDLAGLILVIANSTEGTSAFLVDNPNPNITVINKEHKLGLHTAHLVRLKFNHCSIPANNTLGNPGDGLKIALNALNAGRIGIAAQSLGISEAAFQAALNYSKIRTQFNTPLIKHQAIAFKLADMQTKITASETLLLKACWTQNQHLDTRSIASQAKLFNSEAANDIANEALQIFGGYGYIKANPVEKYFRDARATTIYEGTSEIQRLIISKLL